MYICFLYLHIYIYHIYIYIDTCTYAWLPDWDSLLGWLAEISHYKDAGALATLADYIETWFHPCVYVCIHMYIYIYIYTYTIYIYIYIAHSLQHICGTFGRSAVQ